jgi:hypothetical protein
MPSEVAMTDQKTTLAAPTVAPEEVHETIARAREVRTMARAIREACRQLRPEL